MTVCPCWRRASACWSIDLDEAPTSRIRAALPATTWFTLDRSRDTLPGKGRKICHRQQINFLSFAAARMAVARGCSLPFSRLAIACRSCIWSNPPVATRVLTVGLPSVSVPVLSTIRCLPFHHLQRFRIAHQDALARASTRATMIDMGVASPSAHGQAMMSTATAFTRACA